MSPLDPKSREIFADMVESQAPAMSAAVARAGLAFHPATRVVSYFGLAYAEVLMALLSRDDMTISLVVSVTQQMRDKFDTLLRTLREAAEKNDPGSLS